MKKIICLLICIAVFFTSPYALAYQDTQQIHYVDADAVCEAQTLLQNISQNDIFSEITAEPVSRAVFISAVVDVLSQGTTSSGDLPFADVYAQSTYADSVYTALSMGLISGGDKFRPDDKITYNEAVKIAVSAMGYSQLAQYSGGYPYGYIKIANDKDVLDYLENSDIFTEEHMVVLLYNMLRGEIPEVDYIKSDTVKYRFDGTSLLNSIYGIVYTEGIITKTFATSYDVNYKYSYSNSSVEVDGKSYKSDISLDNCFGMNSIVYYTEKDKKIVCAYPVENREITVSLDDFSDIDGSSFKYYSEEKLKNLKIDRNYIEVYNGRTTYADKNHLSGSKGFVRLVDNNNDGIYDIMFITAYTYVRIKNIDTGDRLIEDAYDAQNNISISEEDVLYTLHNSEGKHLRVAELKADDMLSVAASPDKSVIAMIRIDNMLSGEVQAITDNDKIVIGEKEYVLSKYASMHCKDDIKIGASVSFYPGYGDEIAYIDFKSDMYIYGYVTAIANQRGLTDDYSIKLFSQSGVMRVYDLAERVLFNGKKEKAKDAYSLLEQNFEPQLIRYRLNTDNMISSIDTAAVMDMSTATLADIETQKNDDDCLTKNLYSETTFSYRNNGSFDTFFNGSKAIIFTIPVKASTSNVVDTTLDDEFGILSVSQIRSGTTYSYFDVYDVDEFGLAKVLVGYNVARTSSPYSFVSALTGSYVGGMVSRIRRGISSDEKPGYQIEIWTNGKYNKYFMSDEVDILLPEDDKLSVGDVIRYKLEDGEISDIIIDINADNRAYDKRSAAFNGGDAFLTYQIGQLYSYNSSVCSYSVAKDAQTGIYDFTPVNQFVSQMRSNNICRYDAQTQTVQTISPADLRTYKAYGDMADVIALKQQNLSTQTIFVFGKGVE